MLFCHGSETGVSGGVGTATIVFIGSTFALFNIGERVGSKNFKICTGNELVK